MEEGFDNIFPYPEGTPGYANINGGFFHRLNDKQNASLHLLNQWVQKENINIECLNPFSLSPSLTLLRYLRANNFDVTKATVHIKKNVEWREENTVNNLPVLNPEDILDCSMVRVTELFPHWHCGYDKTGRPVLYKQYAKFECTKLKEVTSIDKLIRYHIWEQEQCMKLCQAQSHRLKLTVETTTAVLDIGGMSMTQITSDFMAIVKSLAQIDQQQYPETLGRFFIINTPSMFPFVWRMVKGFLDPAVAAKISIYGSSKEWEPALFEFIGRENMPSNYGGDLPELTTDIHPYAESMAAIKRLSIRETPRRTLLKNSHSGNVDDVINVHKRKSERIESPVYFYPDNTMGKDSTTGGFYHNLTEHQHHVLVRLNMWVQDNRVDLSHLNHFAIHPSLTLLRYLRANGFDSSKAITHMTKNLAWRQENRVMELVTMDPEEILGCPIASVTELFPHWHCGYDKTGRPVLYKQYAKFECTKLKEVTSIDKLIRYHIWEQEQCMKLCHAQSHRLKLTVETTTAVLDIGGMSMTQITSDFMAIVKSLAQIDQQQYPETLGRFFIINTPSMFPFVWRMVKGFLDPAVAAKISIYGSSKEWEPALFEFIGRENMPSNYGGELPELMTDIHPYAESMAAAGNTAPAPSSIAFTRMSSLKSVESSPRARIVKHSSYKSEVGTFNLNDRIVYPYPDNTPGKYNPNGGFVHFLTENQQKGLVECQSWTEEGSFEIELLNAFAIHPSLTLLRYLRANGFDSSKAITHMTKNLAWRQENRVMELVTMDPEEILGCPIASVTELFPHWHCGYDKTGRPVLYKQYAKFECTKLKEVTSIDKLILYHIWEQEQCMKLCQAQSHRLKLTVETTTAVLDIEGMRMSQVTSDFLAIVKSLAQIDQQQYPETLGRFFIINTPSMFPFVWRMVKGFLDPAVAAKISIYGSRKEWEPALFEFIGRENMPSNYGGELPELTTDIHPYAESMAILEAQQKRQSNRLSLLNNPVDPRLASDNRPLSIQLGRHNLTARSSELESFSTARPFSQSDKITAKTPDEVKLKTFRLAQFASNVSTVFGRGQKQRDIARERDEPVRPAQEVLGTEDLEAGLSPDDGNNSEKFEDYEPSCFRRVKGKLDRWMFSFSVNELKFYLFVALAAYTVVAFASNIVAAIVMGSSSFSTTASATSLWMGCSVLIVSVLIVLCNFAGFVGVYYQNRQLLQAYLACIVVGTFVFFSICIAAFLYAYVPSIQRAANKLVTDDHVVGQSQEAIFKGDLALAISSLFAFLLSFGPITLTAMLISRLKSIQGSKVQPEQLRFVLRLTQWITLVIAIVMLCYGGASMSYLIHDKFTPMIFPVYGLIYGGFTVMILSFMGMWVSRTSHQRVVWVYYRYFVPVVIVLLIICASLSFAYIPSINSKVSNFVKNNSVAGGSSSLAVTVQTQLIVTGILCMFAMFFFWISLFTSRKLYQIMSANSPSQLSHLASDKRVDVTSSSLLYGDEFLKRKIHRSKYDKYRIMWAIVCALYNIYGNGTFAILSTLVSANQNTNDDSTQAVNSLWLFLGDNFDARYKIADPYLVVSAYFCAFILGPTLIIYAWGTYVKAPFRHLLGFLTSAFQVWINVILFCVEANQNFVNYQVNAAAFSILLILWVVFGIAFPLFIFYVEFRSANNSVVKSDNHALLMHINREDRRAKRMQKPLLGDDFRPTDVNRMATIDEDDYCYQGSDDDDDDDDKDHFGMDVALSSCNQTQTAPLAFNGGLGRLGYSLTLSRHDYANSLDMDALNMDNMGNANYREVSVANGEKESDSDEDELDFLVGRPLDKSIYKYTASNKNLFGSSKQADSTANALINSPLSPELKDCKSDEVQETLTKVTLHESDKAADTRFLNYSSLQLIQKQQSPNTDALTKPSLVVGPRQQQFRSVDRDDRSSVYSFQTARGGDGGEGSAHEEAKGDSQVGDDDNIFEQVNPLPTLASKSSIFSLMTSSTRSRTAVPPAVVSAGINDQNDVKFSSYMRRSQSITRLYGSSDVFEIAGQRSTDDIDIDLCSTTRAKSRYGRGLAGSRLKYFEPTIPHFDSSGGLPAGDNEISFDAQERRNIRHSAFGDMGGGSRKKHFETSPDLTALTAAPASRGLVNDSSSRLSSSQADSSNRQLTIKKKVKKNSLVMIV